MIWCVAVGKFAKEVRRFARDAMDRSEDVFRVLAMEISREVILKTPVDSGRLRGNWQSTVNTSTPPATENVDPSGVSAISGSVATAARAKLGDTFILGNNLPYAERIEGGYSKVKSPAGMVAVTVMDFEARAKRLGYSMRLP